MQDMVVSMMKFSTAITMFGVQQVQNAVGALTDPDAAQDRLKRALDAVTDALTAEMSESNKSAQQNMTDLGAKVIDRAASFVDMPVLDPRNVMKTAADVLQRATESVSGVMRDTTSPAAGAAPPPPASGPELAATVLGQ